MAEYKQHSGVRRVPLGALRVARQGHRPYLSRAEFALLLEGPVLIEEKLDGHPEVRVVDAYVFYCEDLRWKHSIAYNAVPFPSGPEAPPYWVCYDVWLADEARWAYRDEKEELCDMVGFPVAPLVYYGEVEADDLPHLADRCSAFGEEQAEGIVIKNYATGVIGKLINIEFQRGIEDAEHWRRRPRVRNRLAHG